MSWLVGAMSAALACGSGEPSRTSERAEAGLRLIVVADLEGALEPCGCGGRPLGGLDRIATVVAELRKDQTPTLLVVAGDLFYAPSRLGKHTAQDALEADAMAAILARLRPDAIAAGPGDLHDAADRLSSLQQAAHAPLLMTGSLQDTSALGQTSALLGQGEQRVGIAVGKRADERAELRRKGARAIIHIGPAAEHALRVDGADILISTGSRTEGSSRERDALRVDPGVRGESMWVIELRAAGAVAKRIELGAQILPDADVRKLIDQTYARINALNAARATDADAKRDAREGTAERPGFVGSRTCAACHTSAYLWWQRTAHGRAYRTLQQRGRELDLDCIACHVTAFEQPGGARIGRLEELADVGCESCHGPGGAHVDDPLARRGNVQREVGAPICASCHDPDHSPRFQYAAWREELLVPAHGRPALER